jgi:phenylpropionate dioxygenase-like ring-hydroxylating dioxygenase large terminal subunit
MLMALSDLKTAGSSLPAAEHIDLRKTGIDPNYWYPVARARSLKKGRVISVSFAGEPSVVVRTASGAIFALEDRCAHRQVPLHAGVVKGECLQCCYHGWTYDRTGRCVNVPYLEQHGDLRSGVRSYPCREAYGLIFIFPGDASKQGQTGFPELSSHADPAYKTRYLDRQVGCHYSFLHENLMDMNHQFLHRRLMGGIRALVLDLRKGDGWVEVDYGFERVHGKQHIGEKFIRGKPKNETAGPKRDMMTVRTEYPYQRLKFWTSGCEQPSLDLWIVYVPIDSRQRANHTFGLMMIKKPGIPGLIQLLWPFIVFFTEKIFNEDRWVVEEEQRAFDLQGADWNQEIFPIILELRRILKTRGVPLPD